MSRKTSTFRGAAAALCVFAIASKPLGQDNPTTANADSPVAPSAIAAAKKDFDSVKASRDAGLQRPADIPRVSVPEWPISAGLPSVTLKPKTKAPARETKSTNWLVDAMEKQPGTRSAGNLTERDRQRRLDVGGREDEADPTAGSDAERLLERNERNDSKKRGEVGKPEIVNPLAAHLGEWMTREDYALLKPG